MKRLIGNFFSILLLLLTVNCGRSNNPDDASVYYKKAVTSYNNGNLHEAVELISEAIELDKTNYGYYSYRAKLFFENGDYGVAISDYTKAINLIKRSEDFLIRHYHDYIKFRFLAYCKIEYFEKAFDDINLLISDDPTNSEYFRLRGDYYTLTDSFNLAINDFTVTLNLDPLDYSAYAFRGFSYYAVGNYKLALHDLLKASTHLNYIDNFILIGACYIECGEYKKSIELLNNYRKVGDDYFNEITLLLAVAYFKLGDYSKSKKLFSDIDSMTIDEDNSYEKLGLSTYYSHEIKKVIKELR